MNCAACATEFTPRREHGRFCSASCRSKARRAPDAVQTIMMVGDVHVPYHDRRAWDCALAAAEHIRPDVFVIMGDFIDCYVCSRFDKAPTRFALLDDELKEARIELAKLEALGLSRVVYVEGNHEHRLTSYVIRNAPALAGLVGIDSALRIRQRGWEWLPYPAHVDVGDLRIQHEPLVGGKHGPRRSLETGGARSWAAGHSHHGGVAYAGTPDGESIYSFSTGWLGDYQSLAFDYCSPTRARQDWRHGFCLAYQAEGRTVGGQFISINSGSCIVEGRRVSA